jgi:hypothetical protein
VGRIVCSSGMNTDCACAEQRGHSQGKLSSDKRKMCSDFLKLFLVYNISNITEQCPYKGRRALLCVWRHKNISSTLVWKVEPVT